LDTVLDILQAAGIGVAVGIRPFLPALLVGALAAANAGVNFGGTDFSFLEKAPFLGAMLLGVVAFDVLRRRAGDGTLETGAGMLGIGAVCVAIGALEGAGSSADRGSAAGGLIAGALCAVLAIVAVTPLFVRVRTRLGAEAGLLPFYREAAALAVAGLSVLFPPLAVVAVAGMVFLLAGGQRREGEKYAGLRILK
jgi:uncharacterized membrane protein